MRLAGFDFRPALVPSMVFLVLLALLLGLGFWQLSRAAEKASLIASKAQRTQSEVRNLNETAVTIEDRFAPVQVEGRYRGERQWLLDNRVVAGQVGYHVYSLFEFAGADHGQSMLVNRGWVPVGETRQFLPNLPTPQEQVTLHGRLDRPASVGIKLATSDLGGLAPAIVVQHLDIDDVAAAIDRELSPYALILDAQQPGALQYDWNYIEAMTPEKHRGYAVQWFGLAVALLIIFIGTNTKRADHDHNDTHTTF